MILLTTKKPRILFDWNALNTITATTSQMENGLSLIWNLYRIQKYNPKNSPCFIILSICETKVYLLCELASTHIKKRSGIKRRQNEGKCKQTLFGVAYKVMMSSQRMVWGIKKKPSNCSDIYKLCAWRALSNW